MERIPEVSTYIRGCLNILQYIEKQEDIFIMKVDISRYESRRKRE